MTAVIAVTTVAAGCAHTAQQPCALNGNPSSLGLCIDTTTTLVKDREITVSAQVRNVRLDRGVEGKTWWVLAPIGPGAPWDRAVYQSTFDERAYVAGGSAFMTWDAVMAVPDGLYDLALLVHVVNSDGTETHADYRGAGPIHLSAPSSEPWLIRHDQSPGPVLVVAASGPRPSGSGLSPFVRLVTLSNMQDSAVAAAVQLAVRTSPIGTDSQWWSALTLYTTTPVTIDLAGRETRTIPLDMAGPSAVLATYPDAQFGVLVSVGTHQSDSVFLGNAASFAPSPPSIYARHFPPSGPIEITGIDERLPWRRSTRHSVALVVNNLSASPQSARVWWYLARPSDPAPWTDARSAGGPVEFTLGPWATRLVVVSAFRQAPAGQWELSGWVHYKNGNGIFEQADALWVRDTLTVN